MKNQTKWESFEDAKKRIDAERANKKARDKKEIMRQLHDPNISEEQKSELMELLYHGIAIK